MTKAGRDKRITVYVTAPKGWRLWLGTAFAAVLALPLAIAAITAWYLGAFCRHMGWQKDESAN